MAKNKESEDIMSTTESITTPPANEPASKGFAPKPGPTLESKFKRGDKVKTKNFTTARMSNQVKENGLAYGIFMVRPSMTLTVTLPIVKKSDLKDEDAFISTSDSPYAVYVDVKGWQYGAYIDYEDLELI